MKTKVIFIYEKFGKITSEIRELTAENINTVVKSYLLAPSMEMRIISKRPIYIGKKVKVSRITKSGKYCKIYGQHGLYNICEYKDIVLYI